MKKWVVKNKIDRNNCIYGSELISSLLHLRGIVNEKDVESFLHPSLDKLYNPFLLKDMDRAVKRIDDAIKGRQKVVIYGDYDADGITSTSILYTAFKRLGVDISYYIPDRMNEGYGINTDALNYIKSLAADLIITVDCGVTSFDEVEYAKSIGMDIIITDHHECKGKIPDTIVVNPKRSDCTYPFKFLSGCGIAFKLIQALWINYGLSGYDDFLDIAAIGTVADSVSLTGENRIIVKNGLNIAKNTEKCGIKALKTVSGIEELNSRNLAFGIVPRINAVGRLSDAKIAVELFTTNNYDKALQIAKYLDQENKKRQEIEEQIYKEACEKIEEDKDFKEEKVIVLASNSWHVGVVGIVASKLVEKFNRPAILLCEEGEIARGSGRSIEGFNLFENLSKCSSLLERFGGHELAAGLSIKTKNINNFRLQLNSLAAGVRSEIFQEKLFIDMQIEPEDVNIDSAEIINEMEPFGFDNLEPVFSMCGVNVLNKWTVGDKSQHLRMTIESNGYKYNCIMFNGSSAYYNKQWDIVDIAFNMNINEWNNNRLLQLVLKDIKPNQKWICSDLENNYYRAIKYCLNNNRADFNFEGINFIKYDDKLLKDFVFLKKGYILVSSFSSMEKIRNLWDTIDINIGCNDGLNSQLILCPIVDDIDFGNNNVIIYDFLPGIYEYKILREKVKNSIYNFYTDSLTEVINKYLNDIVLNKDILIKFIENLKQSEEMGTVSSMSKKYGVNLYKMYKMIMYLKSLNAVQVFLKNDILKIRWNNKYDESKIKLNFQNDLINKINDLQLKFRSILGEG
ncbi:MAG TPA: single-stranded-DNA-specific exonuclease RecJ [Clostridiaceae bacterium]|jgi:single-stranded-DNA-specific exonuclease|nr:single-stranded-DNA-specific exonuclease RecJ [Clostridiaceae bacterium]HBG39140.1 single-stranded-DNA-specific exonuclease RecJ [Clostridiaceae bacterium]HBN29089.1 single-stranded-DNA-specific exonuclease RecJ [Clostridiaceae bacterium]HBX48559.1 single-stranded-DNA-specific exonuclease RecJ [Clostridiaceae bacterium]HCL49505.1 single-stranded-DNA-specific exonuclease RecJ [Clostridiaceae bacterium]